MTPLAAARLVISALRKELIASNIQTATSCDYGPTPLTFELVAGAVTPQYAELKARLALTIENPSASSYQGPSGGLVGTIVRLCEEHWRRTGRAYLLSQLGLDLRREGYDLRRALKGTKLLPFLTAQLSGALRLEQNPKNPIVWGVFPKSEALSGDLASYFQYDVEPRSPTASGEIRFNKAFWAAFVIPLQAGTIRILRREPFIQFNDVPASEAVPEDAVPIEPEFIVSEEMLSGRERHDRVYKSVIAWCELHQLDAQIFAIKVTGPHHDRGSVERSVLHILLEQLGPRDLARISMPLDLVSKLLAEPAKRD